MAFPFGIAVATSSLSSNYFNNFFQSRLCSSPKACLEYHPDQKVSTVFYRNLKFNFSSFHRFQPLPCLTLSAPSLPHPFSPSPCLTLSAPPLASPLSAPPLASLLSAPSLASLPPAHSNGSRHPCRRPGPAIPPDLSGGCVACRFLSMGGPPALSDTPLSARPAFPSFLPFPDSHRAVVLPPSCRNPPPG